MGKESSDSCDFEPDIDPGAGGGRRDAGVVVGVAVSTTTGQQTTIEKEPWHKYRYNKVTYRCRKWGVLGGWRYD